MLPEKWCIENSSEIRTQLSIYFERILSYAHYDSYMTRYNLPDWSTFNYPNYSDKKGYRKGCHTGRENGYTMIELADLIRENNIPTVNNSYTIL